MRIPVPINAWEFHIRGTIIQEVTPVTSWAHFLLIHVYREGEGLSIFSLPYTAFLPAFSKGQYSGLPL